MKPHHSKFNEQDPFNTFHRTNVPTETFINTFVSIIIVSYGVVHAESKVKAKQCFVQYVTTARLLDHWG